MDAAAAAALAAIVEHDHARVLDELVRESIQLREQLEQQRLQLAQQHLRVREQALDIAQLRNTVVELSLKVHQLSGTIAWALHDVQMGEIETAEQRLTGCFNDENDAANAEQ